MKFAISWDGLKIGGCAGRWGWGCSDVEKDEVEDAEKEENEYKHFYGW